MITLAEFQARRKAIFNLMPDNSIALLCAAPQLHRNSDTEFPYRQDSYFYYVTGFEESFAIAVLLKKEGKTQFILFCQDKDPAIEQWTGERVGHVNALQVLGADLAYSIADASIRIPEFLSGLATVYSLININPSFDKKCFAWIETLRKKARAGVSVPHQFIDLRVILDEDRLIKTTEELALIRKACDISSHGHIQAMQRCQAGMKEYEIEAILLYEFYRQGSRSPAYPCIVAAGNNACTLHYIRNQSTLKDNELLLIDAGAEFENYASDITRTFPINGKFSANQQAIYELVLAAQMAAIELAKPGVMWHQIQQVILGVLVSGLVDLKILKGDPKTLIEEKAYLPFYMHNSGHWMGLDVHDVGDYKKEGQWRKLAKGMVFTIEPGLYLGQNNVHVPESWRGIGIRIEDDVLITENGVEVLTQVPKTVNEIEKTMQRL